MSGVLITITGHYIEMMILGPVISTIGCGLIYTFDIGTPSREWIGYQALAGIGFGLSIQIPVIVAQGISTPEDLSPITALIIFFQTLSGAVWVSVGQSLFTNELKTSVPEYAPGVSASKVISTGATDLRRTFSRTQLPGIIRAYMQGLKQAYILGIALAGFAVLVGVAALVLDWRILPRGAAQEVEAEHAEEEQREQHVI